MAKKIRIGNISFESTTDSDNIKISDDQFALLLALQRLTLAIERLAGKFR